MPPEDENNEAGAEVEPVTPTETESTTTPTVDFESTISALGETITAKDAEIARLSTQLASAQSVNSTLLRQVGSVAAPDAHEEVDRTNISISDLLYGTD